MKKLIWLVLPYFLGAEPPLTLEEVLSKSKVSIAKLNVDAVLAEGRHNIKDSSGFLRESPTIAVSAGPRTSSHAPGSTDQTIEAVSGVARVDRQGGQEKSLQISLSPEKMRVLGISLDRVLEALEDTHQDMGAGVIEIQDKVWYVSIGNLAASPEDVRRLPLQLKSGWITLGEVADIREAPGFRRGLVRHDGHEDVGISIIKQPTASSRDVAENVRVVLDELNKELPEGMSLKTIYDQGLLVDKALNGVTLALLAGGILALWLTGETWNISSIVGMIGLFGVAVQNSLVLISQAKGLIASGLPFQKALEEASLGRLRPKLMTAGSTILGLLPILMGFSGSELERPLAVVLIGGLISSTIFTLLALPSFYA